jgi:hypothetical protein
MLRDARYEMRERSKAMQSPTSEIMVPSNVVKSEAR